MFKNPLLFMREIVYFLAFDGVRRGDVRGDGDLTSSAILVSIWDLCVSLLAIFAIGMFVPSIEYLIRDSDGLIDGSKITLVSVFWAVLNLIYFVCLGKGRLIIDKYENMCSRILVRHRIFGGTFFLIVIIATGTIFAIEGVNASGSGGGLLN